MSLATRLTRASIRHGSDTVTPAAQGFADPEPALVGLLAGIAGCGPFLAGRLLGTDPSNPGGHGRRPLAHRIATAAATADRIITRALVQPRA